MDLKEKYGIYTIKKGTKLFRQAFDTNIYETMFFSFSYDGTYSSSYRNNTIQVWETLADINSLLMVNGRNYKRLISAIVDIYNNFFPDDKQDNNSDVFLKQGDKPERKKLIDALKKNNITNWVSSIENKMDMEFFTFGSKKENENIIKYCRPYCSNDPEDTFDRSIINQFP